MRLSGMMPRNTRMAIAILAQGNRLELERAAIDYCLCSNQQLYAYN